MSPLPLAHTSPAYAMAELVPITIAVVLYGQRVKTLAWKGRPVPGWRVACFATGLILIVAVGLSPVGQLSDELVYMHMVEHLVIGDLAPLLIVLGLTGPILQPVLAIRGLGWLRRLANPLLALPLWAISLYTWHIPPLYQDAFGGAPVHVAEHGCFVVFGCLMWMPLVGPLPMPEWFGNLARLGYTVGVRFTSAVLGNVLMWSATVLYPVYAAGEAEQGVSPLTDQSTAGAIMMAEGTFVTLGVFAYLFFRAAREDSERQRLVELAAARGIPLDERRAIRAVRAGQAERLERQILGGLRSVG